MGVHVPGLKIGVLLGKIYLSKGIVCELENMSQADFLLALIMFIYGLCGLFFPFKPKIGNFNWKKWRQSQNFKSYTGIN